MTKFEKFDVDLDGGKSNASRWNIWLRRFDLFVEANEIIGDRKMIATLLNEAGSGIEEIYEAKRDVAVLKANEKYTDISKLLTDHFAPQKNVTMNRIKFRELHQYSGEGIKSYYVRLKTASVDCEFTKIEEEIALQLIQGSNDRRVKLKAAQEDIKLEALLKFIESLEFSSEVNNNNLSYKKEQGACKVESVYKVQNSKSISGEKCKSSKRCFHCGGDYPHVDICPAKDRKCHACGNKGHYIKFCKDKKKWLLLSLKCVKNN